MQNKPPTTFHACKIFNCDRQHGSYCCYFCKIRNHCKNPCLNDPVKCRQHTVSTTPPPMIRRAPAQKDE